MEHTLQIRWGTSRGRDSYGYTTCSLSENGKRIAACNGGGYDMRGTVFGNWLSYAYADRLRALKESDMPENFHWQPDFGAFICRVPACYLKRDELGPVKVSRPDVVGGGEPWPTCPECGGEMDRDGRAGERIDDGRALYGLRFHDPNYDAGKAVIGKDCSDRTLGDGAEGKSVADAEKAGESFGLERLQATYSASSKYATERHTVPSIDGACGFDSVRRIAEAIGLEVRMIDAGSKRDVITVTEARAEAAA